LGADDKRGDGFHFSVLEIEEITFSRMGETAAILATGCDR